MRSAGRLLVIITLSVLLHLLLGWMWTAVAGIAAGVWQRRRGWLVGLVGVALGWTSVIIYSFLVAPNATAEMARIFGSIIGNLPAAVTVAATILIGASIGGLGGAAGQLALASWPRHTRAHT